MKTIIDVSSVVYAGHNGRPNMRFQGFPVGGIYSLLRLIAAELDCTDFILCFDGGDILKKELLPAYKAGRIPDYSVLAQIDVLKELLTACDIPFYHDPKYEADDFVYSVCAAIDGLNDTGTIKVMSDDRDLSCVVRSNCSLFPVSTNGCCINKNNFSERVVRGKNVAYNTILLWKLFHGDTSDHYKGVKLPGIDYDSMSRIYLDAITPLIGPTGFSEMVYSDYDVFEVFLKQYPTPISEEDMKTILATARIVFPYRLNVFTTDRDSLLADVGRGALLHMAIRNHMKIFGETNIDTQRFDFITAMIGPRGGYRRRFRGYNEDGKEGEELRQYFALKAKDLSNGVMAVERYRSKKAVQPMTEPLQNMELPI